VKIKNYIKILSVLGLLATPTIAEANDFSQDSRIDILRALNVTETQKMDFGVIEEPVDDVRVHVTAEGFISTSNTATHIDTSTVAAGIYQVFGSDLSSISISARNGGSVPSMTFETLHASYGAQYSDDLLTSPLTALGAPGAMGTELAMGAILKVNAGTTEGTYAPDFILEVNYE